MFRNRCTVTLFAKDVFNTNYQKVDIQSPGVQAFVDERHNKRVLGIAFAWRFQKGSETKESRRKKEIDETKRVICNCYGQTVEQVAGAGIICRDSFSVYSCGE